MHDRLEESPLETHLRHLRQGELIYQFDTIRKRAIFFPRVPAPGSEIEWRTSTGRGTVYATTVVFPRGGTPYNVVLIDLAEGFRMMSRVEGIEAQQVRIGDRVRARIIATEGEQQPLVIFEREEGTSV